MATLKPAKTVWPASQAGLYGAIGEILPDLFACVPETPDLLEEFSGALSFEVTVVEVNGIGQVASIDLLHETSSETAVTDCMLEHMLDLEFDAPAVGQPFVGTMDLEYGTD